MDGHMKFYITIAFCVVTCVRAIKILRQKDSSRLWPLSVVRSGRPYYSGRAYAIVLCPSVVRLSVTYVLWLNGTSRRKNL